MNFKNTQEFLTSRQFNPSKKMGQNFLINENISKDIINSIDFKNIDLVIEIGPGLGALTDNLIDKSFNLILIELDKRLNEFLNKRYKNKNITIINQDVLRVDFDKLVQGCKNPIVVSNLPYSISSLVVLKFLKCNKIKNFYCMLQKEMVDRISAPVGSKKYNGYTVLVSYYCQIKKILSVSAKNFLPTPEVDSYFISISKNKKQYDELFDKFLRTCFLARRKTLINNLKHQFDLDKIKQVVKSIGFNENTRAEELTPDELYKLYKILW